MTTHQKENGTTPIANSLLEAIAAADLSKRELKILLVVIRRTYGFNKRTAPLSASFIAAATGLDRAHIARTVSGMVQRGILTRDRTQAVNVIGLNKRFFPFRASAKTALSPSAETATVENSASAKTATVGGAVSATLVVPKQPHNKDTSKDRSKDNAQLPPRLDPQTWEDWQQHRREIRKKLTPSTTSRQLAMLAKQPDPNACITQSIEAGWTGLFAMKTPGSTGNGKLNGSGHRGQRTTQDILDDALAALDGEPAESGHGTTVDQDGRVVR